MYEKQDLYENGYILYDGSCGGCTFLAGRWSNFLARYGIKFVALQEGWIQERYPEKMVEFQQEMHMLFSNGEFKKGLEVYREIWKKVSYLKPIYWISLLPIVSWLFNKAYLFIAKHRRAISNFCGLQSRARF